MKRFFLYEILILLIATSITFGLMMVTSAKPTGTISVQRPTIVIDAGHGGLDGGVVGLRGIIEKDINLPISLYLRDMLMLSGYEVVMTRTDDISLHTDKDKTVAAKKKSDLHKRLSIFEKSSKNIVISVHQNKYEQESAKGAQIFYGEQNANSMNLAQCLQNSFKSRLDNENKRLIKKATSDLFIIKNATVPTVMVECGFLSNPVEVRLLTTDDYQRKVAFTIYSGLLEFLDKGV